MTRPLLTTVTLSALALALPAHADLTLRFDEGAPKDRFTLTNTGACDPGPMSVTIDLSGSASGLIFDTDQRGAGVQVFQPFVLIAGADRVTTLPKVSDGDTSVTLDLDGLAQAQSVAFTIDVDDTVGTREITVSGSEIAGALLRITAAGTTREAAFGTDARATLPTAACLS